MHAPTDGEASGEYTPTPTARRLGAGWLLKLAVSTLLIVWVVAGAEMTEVLAAIGEADLRLVLLALGLNVIGWVITVTRWRLLLAARGVTVPFRTALGSYLAAFFLNNVLPSTIGGDTLRAWDSWRWGAGKAGAVAVVTVDRMCGMLVLMVFGALAAFVVTQVVDELPRLPIWLAIGAVGLMAAAGLAFLPLPGLRRWLGSGTGYLPRVVREPILGIANALASFRVSPGTIPKCLGLSALLQVNTIVHFYLIAAALSLDVSLAGFFLITPIALAVMAVPISVNAIGIRENVFALFLGFFGISAGAALAFSWISFGLVLAQGAVGGVVYATRVTPTALPSAERPAH